VYNQSAAAVREVLEERMNISKESVGKREVIFMESAGRTGEIRGRSENRQWLTNVGEKTRLKVTKDLNYRPLGKEGTKSKSTDNGRPLRDGSS